jgi:hypothetical protein
MKTQRKLIVTHKFEKAEGILDTPEKVQAFHDYMHEQLDEKFKEIDEAHRKSWAAAWKYVLD